eukprot:GHUV01049657.1.p2 GENE.GHUV01049657.1~~GHUV01049657.1.p2  ORF type:complete len:104 (-),score=17.74 GHUV01049657.1:40-351(-)
MLLIGPARLVDAFAATCKGTERLLLAPSRRWRPDCEEPLYVGSRHCGVQEEVAALEAANVYAILESGPLVEGVIGQLRHTQTVLDDLDESLKVHHDPLHSGAD